MLGLKFVKNDGFAAVFDAGDRMVRVVDATQVPEFKAQLFTVLGLEVEDVVRTASALKERGIFFETYPWIQQDKLGIWTAPSGDQIAWFKDPDGNVLSISRHV